MKRLFILRELVHFESLLAFLRSNWQGFASMEKPLAVRLSVYKADRSSEANSLMWVWLGQAAHQAWSGGRQYVAEIWHEHCKREFLPEVNNKGDEKWQFLPNGERICVMSTTRLDSGEMSEYMTAIEAFLVGDLGVELV